MDRSTLQKLSFAYMCGHLGHGEEYFNRKQLRIYGNFEGNLKRFLGMTTIGVCWIYSIVMLLFTAYKRFVTSYRATLDSL